MGLLDTKPSTVPPCSPTRPSADRQTKASQGLNYLEPRHVDCRCVLERTFGLSLYLRVTKTKTMILPFFSLSRRPRKGLSDESRQAFLNCSSRSCWKDFLHSEHRPYPCGTFNSARQLHRIEEASDGAMTFPTELSHLPAFGIKSLSWTLRGSQLRTARSLAASPRILSGGS